MDSTTTDYLGQTEERRSSASGESEDSYAEILSSDDSYYSDGGDLVEYWDPYCEYKTSSIRSYGPYMLDIVVHLITIIIILSEKVFIVDFTGPDNHICKCPLSYLPHSTHE